MRIRIQFPEIGNADPDQVSQNNADPDPVFQNNADPDPVSQNNADLDLQPCFI